MPALVAGIHVFAAAPRRKTWMAGTTLAAYGGSPGHDDAVRAESPHRERRVVRPAKRHAGRDRLHGLEKSVALAAVVARVDERHRPFHQLHDGDVTRRADLQRAELRRATDHLGRIDRGHRDHLLEREAEA